MRRAHGARRVGCGLVQLLGATELRKCAVVAGVSKRAVVHLPLGVEQRRNLQQMPASSEAST